ncbi:MAG TPA: hypothetical protein VGK82_05440 [Pyrinomonadaceae bacterium]
MKILVAFLSLILLTNVASCNRGNDQASSILGEYELVGLDNSGRRAFTGTISLVSLEQNHVNGQCKLVREKDANSAILDQTPRCQALLQGKKITIDFAPSLDDGGLLFEGKIGGDGLSGVWMFKTFAGTQPQGTFEAIKK